MAKRPVRTNAAFTTLIAQTRDDESSRKMPIVEGLEGHWARCLRDDTEFRQGAPTPSIQ